MVALRTMSAFNPSDSLFLSPSSTRWNHSEQLGKLRSQAPSTISASNHYQSGSHFTLDLLQRLDQTQVLGSGNQTGLSRHSTGIIGSGNGRENEHFGHTGCVNALSWSKDGQWLASGSDDTRVCLWKVGGSIKDGVAETSSQEQIPWQQRHDQTSLHMGLEHVIATGHRRNIFSVRFAPNCASQRLFTAAGDGPVRVFDLERATDSTIRSVHRSNNRGLKGFEYTLWNEENTRQVTETSCCIRVFKCHRSRVKRIATEQSPDTFLSCGEDGTVRQMDLRAHHNCDSRDVPFPLPSFLQDVTFQDLGETQIGGCPRALCEYQSMELYSLTVDPMQPYLFVVAGTSPYAYLHDRRMVRSALGRDWGKVGFQCGTDGDDGFTQIVRKFGLPDMLEEEKEELESVHQTYLRERQTMKRRRQQTVGLERRRRESRNHFSDQEDQNEEEIEDDDGEEDDNNGIRARLEQEDEAAHERLSKIRKNISVDVKERISPQPRSLNIDRISYF